MERIKESLFKKQSLNIYKAKSRFRVNSKKAFVQDKAPSLVRHIVKGYLASYVLYEREKKDIRQEYCIGKV